MDEKALKVEKKKKIRVYRSKNCIKYILSFGIIKHLEKMGSHLMDGKSEIWEYTIILKSPDDVYFYVNMLAKEAEKKCLSALFQY